MGPFNFIIFIYKAKFRWPLNVGSETRHCVHYRIISQAMHAFLDMGIYSVHIFIEAMYFKSICFLVCFMSKYVILQFDFETLSV